MLDRKFLYIGGGVVALLLIILLVVGFSTKKKTTNPTETPSNKIVVWDSFDDEYNFKDLFTQFENENDIEIDYVKKDPAKYETESVEALASATGPDVWIIPNNWMPKHHDKLVSFPDKTLDPKGKKDNASVYKDTYVLAASSDNIIENQVYGFPLFMDSLALFYNSKLMQNRLSSYLEANPRANNTDVATQMSEPPKTWDELVNFVKLYGENAIALGGSSKLQNSQDILTTLMLQYGARMTNDDNTAALFQTSANKFTDEAYPGTQALEFYTSFALKGNDHYTWNSANDAYTDFANDKVALMINYSRSLNDLNKNDAKYKLATLPQISSTSTAISLASYQVMTVPKSSKNQDAAWNLINYLRSDSISNSYLTVTNLLSPLKKDPSTISNDISIQNQSAQTWYNPDPAKTKTIFESAVDQVLSGNKAQTVLEGAAAQVTTLLGEISK